MVMRDSESEKLRVFVQLSKLSRLFLFYLVGQITTVPE